MTQLQREQNSLICGEGPEAWGQALHFSLRLSWVSLSASRFMARPGG